LGQVNCLSENKNIALQDIIEALMHYHTTKVCSIATLKKLDYGDNGNN
jgi:hypothetical protein